MSTEPDTVPSGAAMESTDEIVARMKEAVEGVKAKGFEPDINADITPAEDAEIAGESEQGDPYENLSAPEKAAWDKGWRPQDQFDGDPTKWVDADKFLDREPFFSRISELNKAKKTQEKELQALKKAVETLTELNKTAYTKGFTEARDELMSKRKEAFEDRDLEAFEEAEAELKKLDAEASAVTALTTEEEQVQPEKLDPEVATKFNSWIEANSSWYGKNDEATGAAKAIAARVAQENDGKADDVEILNRVLAEIDRKITKRFPELFENPARRKAPTVGSASTKGSKGGIVASAVAAMPAEHRVIMKKILASTNMTEEAYMAQYNRSR